MRRGGGVGGGGLFSEFGGWIWGEERMVMGGFKLKK